MDLITSKELINALDTLVFLDCFLAFLIAHLTYDLFFFLLHRFLDLFIKPSTGGRL